MKADAKPSLDDVAKLIAKGDAPWLVPALERFSGFISGNPVSSKERKRQDKIIARMHDATDYLTKFLPLFAHLPLGLRSRDVAVALAVLPKIKKGLAYAMPSKRGGGQHPSDERKLCAAVVVEAWRSVHGKPEPESPKLWTACNEYWRACGHAYRGSDVDTWRKDCRDAVADNHEWIRQILSGRIQLTHDC
jgi:hypothetical protein